MFTFYSNARCSFLARIIIISPFVFHIPVSLCKFPSLVSWNFLFLVSFASLSYPLPLLHHRYFFPPLLYILLLRHQCYPHFHHFPLHLNLVLVLLLHLFYFLFFFLPFGYLHGFLHFSKMLAFVFSLNLKSVLYCVDW